MWSEDSCGCQFSLSTVWVPDQLRLSMSAASYLIHSVSAPKSASTVVCVLAKWNDGKVVEPCVCVLASVWVSFLACLLF